MSLALTALAPWLEVLDLRVGRAAMVSTRRKREEQRKPGEPVHGVPGSDERAPQSMAQGMLVRVPSSFTPGPTRELPPSQKLFSASPSAACASGRWGRSRRRRRHRSTGGAASGGSGTGGGSVSTAGARGPGGGEWFVWRQRLRRRQRRRGGGIKAGRSYDVLCAEVQQTVCQNLSCAQGSCRGPFLTQCLTGGTAAAVPRLRLVDAARCARLAKGEA